MKALYLASLLLALSFPTLAEAQRRSVWDPIDWDDRESLTSPRPDPMYRIAGSGRLTGQIGTNHPFDLPPAFWLLGDEPFRKSLCRELRDGDAEALEKDIERKVEEYEARFLELSKKLKTIENREERIAEIDVFEGDTKARLGELRGRLTPSQQEKCERGYPLGDFYLFGPIEFARRRGATESELAEIGSRMRDLREPLRTELRKAETETLLKVLDKLQGDGIEKIRTVVETASPRRYGVLFTLHEDLAKFDAPPIGLKKAATTEMRRYWLSDYGKLSREDEIPVDLFFDMIDLFSVQELGARDREIADSFLKLLFETEIDPDSETRRLKAKKGDLHRQAMTEKNADTKFQLFAEMAKVEAEMFDLRNAEFQALMGLLSEDGRRTIEEGFLILYMQRFGCTRVLASKHAHDRFGLAVDAASWQALEAEASPIATELRQRAVEIQQEYVKQLYRGTSLEKEFEEAWVRTADEDSVPRVELLIFHTDEAASRRAAGR